MNRRGFLRGALGLAAMAVIPASVARAASREDGIDFLCGEMTKGARRGAQCIPDDWIQAKLDEMKLARCDAFAEQAQAICDAIKPAIDAIAGLAEVKVPTEWHLIDGAGTRIPLDGRVWYVGPHGDDANDGLTPDTALLTSQAVVAACSPSEPQDVTVYLWGPTKEL